MMGPKHIALIAAMPDAASLTQKKSMLSLYPFLEGSDEFDGNKTYTYSAGDNRFTLYTLSKKALYYNDLDKQIDADVLVFLSKHVAKSGIPSYTCHALGNWSIDATYGGLPKTVSASSPSLMRAMLRARSQECKETHRDIVHEVTHHGPYLEKPGIYVEIGSSEEQYGEKDSGDRLARAVMGVFTTAIEPCVGAIGIGGLHTAPIFSRLTLTTKLGFSHMIPKHMLEHITPEILRHAASQSTEEIKFLVLDWKSLTPHKELVMKACAATGIPVMRSDQVARYKEVME